MQLHIKNMVCDRCIAAVRSLLENQQLQPEHIQLGQVRLKEFELSPEALHRLSASLEGMGFELIDDRRSQLIDSIRSCVIRLVHHYSYLSKLFSDTEGITIEQYIIRQKVEKVKEYLVYDELSLGEIADKMGYSSGAHLSGQFRKLTNMTPTAFKKGKNPQRSGLDKIL
jgi:hypothetical protein